MGDITDNQLAALEGVSAISGAFANLQEVKARRAISKTNAALEEMRATQARKGGQRAVLKSRQKFKKLLGKQKASLAAQGLRTTGGSAQDIQQETQDMSEMDALTISLNANRKAFGFEASAEEEKVTGKLAGIAGKGDIAQSLLVGGLKTIRAKKGII